ncbi:unnamed protein product, partial [Allacma fusca]
MGKGVVSSCSSSSFVKSSASLAPAQACQEPFLKKRSSPPPNVVSSGISGGKLDSERALVSPTLD